jgi:hypothetical protein
MKIQEVLTLAEPDFPRDAPRRLGSQDILPDAEPNPNHGETDELSLAPDPSPTSPVTISPAHRRDLDFIKFQLARLPAH